MEELRHTLLEIETGFIIIWGSFSTTGIRKVYVNEKGWTQYLKKKLLKLFKLIPDWIFNEENVAKTMINFIKN